MTILAAELFFPLPNHSLMILISFGYNKSFIGYLSLKTVYVSDLVLENVSFSA